MKFGTETSARKVPRPDLVAIIFIAIRYCRGEYDTSAIYQFRWFTMNCTLQTFPPTLKCTFKYYLQYI